jgi:pimeloyl-ACP methyl ester carboxylesterase
MWNSIGRFSKPDYGRFHLQHWVESPNPFAPLIIVIPGFLTQQDPIRPFDEWSEPVIQLAQERGLSAAGLYWPSGHISDFFENINLLDYAGAGLLTMGFKALKVWERALNATEQAGRNFREWLPQGPRPIILLGHSLGARLALITAEHVPLKRLSGVITFAAAYESRVCNYSHLDRGVSQPPLIAYSHNDSVLKTLFIAGQNPEIITLGLAGQLFGEAGLPVAFAKYTFDRNYDIALGSDGPPHTHQGMCTSWNVSDFDHQSVGHGDYVELLPKLLNDYHITSLLH